MAKVIQKEKGNLFSKTTVITALFSHQKHHFTVTAHLLSNRKLLGTSFRNCCKSVHCNHFSYCAKQMQKWC